jgi:hypothetical protein
MTLKPHTHRIINQAEEPVDIRVCNIAFRRNDEHEALCVRAIRQRNAPPWSASYSDYVVEECPQ